MLERWYVSTGHAHSVVDANGRAIATCAYSGRPQAEREANAALIAAASDHAIVLRHLANGTIRWEPMNVSGSGELCCGGLRYITVLDEFGCPRLPDPLRAQLARRADTTQEVRHG